MKMRWKWVYLGRKILGTFIDGPYRNGAARIGRTYVAYTAAFGLAGQRLDYIACGGETPIAVLNYLIIKDGLNRKNE